MITGDRPLDFLYYPQPAKTEPDNLAVIKAKISSVFKKSFIFLLGTTMFATNPTLFSVTVICSAIWDQRAEAIIEKINAIWTNQKWNVTVMAAIAAALAIQVTWAFGSIFFAMNLGKNLAPID